ncbi:MAG: hypothetical protein OET79_17110 [Nitrospirota bacterium]|nr:hypothetical protein [Nitrospirota bacterium]
MIDVHHVHAWSITQERPMVTLHARVSTNTLPEAITAAIKARLDERLGVAHTTVEVERDQCADDGNSQYIKFHAEDADG